MMTTKFCTSCQTTQPLATGMFKKSRTVNRWICFGCVNKMHDGTDKGRRAALEKINRIAEFVGEEL